MIADDIERNLRRLGVDHLPDALRPRLEALPDPQQFARSFKRLVDAELAGDFKIYGHGKRSSPEKALFHKEESDLASELLGAVYPAVEVDKTRSGPLGQYDEALVTRASQALEDDGYFVWPTVLAPEVVDGLVDGLRGLPFFERGTLAPVDGYDPATASDHKTNRVQLKSELDLLRQPAFQPFIYDPMAMEIVQRNFKCCPVHTQLGASWTLPGSTDKQDLSRAALLFHQDKDWVKFIKVFIYLTDVDEESGPHVYVQGSHLDYRSKHSDRMQFSRRFDDDEVREVFGADRVKTLTGPRGTVIFADTSGYHKGEAVRRDHRLVMLLEWACSLYFSPQEPLDEAVLDDTARGLRAQTPRYFQHYDGAARRAWVDARAKEGRKPGLLRRLEKSVRKRLKL